MTRRSLQCLVSTIFLCFYCRGVLALRAQGPDDGPKTPPEIAAGLDPGRGPGARALNPDDAYLQYVALQLARNEQQDRPRSPRRSSNSMAAAVGADGRPTAAWTCSTCSPGPWPCRRACNWTRCAAGGHSRRGRQSRPATPSSVADLARPDASRAIPGARCWPPRPWPASRPEVSPLVALRAGGPVLRRVPLAGASCWRPARRATCGAITCSPRRPSRPKSQRAGERLKAQLAIQTDPLTRPFYDMVVEEVALTGSDLYFREGTDVTMLFAVKQPEVFRLRMDGFLEAAAKSRPDAVRSTGQDPGRRLRARSPRPTGPSRRSRPIRGRTCTCGATRRPALERVLAAIDRRAGRVARLGDAAEFKYIRTLMPRGDKREDGFVYLSDPFIRRLVGPEVKLTERRRMVCYNHLRMIGHAAMLYRTQFGRQAKSLDELVEAGCAPEFFTDAQAGRRPGVARLPLRRQVFALGRRHDRRLLASRPRPAAGPLPGNPPGAGDARRRPSSTGSSSRTTANTGGGTSTRSRSGSRSTPKQYRVETIILPLIDNSIYTGLADGAGRRAGAAGRPAGAPAEHLQRGGAAEQGAAAQAVHRRPPASNRELSPQWPSPGAGSRSSSPRASATRSACTSTTPSPMFDFNLTGFLGEMMGRFRGTPGRLSDEMAIVTFPGGLAQFAGLRRRAGAGREGGRQVPRRARRGRWPAWPGNPSAAAGSRWTTISTRSPLAGQRRADPLLRHFAGAGEVAAVLRPAGQRPVHRQQAVHPGRPGGGQGEAALTPCPSPACRVRQDGRGRWARRPMPWSACGPSTGRPCCPSIGLGWEEGSRQACLENLGPLSSVGRAMAATRSTGYPGRRSGDVQRQADRLFGVHFYCPDGGKYELSADGKRVTCSVHGSADAPRQLAAPAAGSPTGRLMSEFGGATAALTFLEDGLHAVVTIAAEMIPGK